MTGSMVIAGEWTEGDADSALSVTSPATGESLGTVPIASPTDVERAVAGARAGAIAMEAMPPFERAAALHRAADLIESAADELGRLLALEAGKPLRTEALPEVEEAAENFRWAAEEAKRLETPNLPGADPNKLVMTFRKPNGVYAVLGVELPGLDPGGAARAGPRGWQRVHPQAVGAESARRRPPGGAAVGGGLSARRGLARAGRR